ncbi:hypothetical protein D1AOALGA4SA_553 [Olavius algarvensis Delta 1 endosymbiont]|nr:hypothetical protein D1AOALGA4SA_553 [Olavius algarvensis Delta 1 endosymbiont]
MNAKRSGLSLNEPPDFIPGRNEPLFTFAVISDSHVNPNESTSFSKVWSSKDAERDGSAFKHFINHGFNTDERDTIEAFLELPGAPEVADGFVFRVGCNSSPWEKIQSAQKLAASCQVNAEITRFAATASCNRVI